MTIGTCNKSRWKKKKFPYLYICALLWKKKASIIGNKKYRLTIKLLVLHRPVGANCLMSWCTVEKAVFGTVCIVKP